jgi:two-component system response regulator AtoC
MPTISEQTPASSLSLLSPIDSLPPEDVAFGRSEAMQVVRRKVQRVAGTSVPVLITGESGTGKEVMAKLLHKWSPWGDGPFVKVNCPAIPSALLESELFGYERGAFTGAYGSKPGRVELADRGTLFLDEIAELEPGLQAKLLQLLQDGQFSRIGAQEDKRVEVRVVCATNRQLEKEMEAGSFRHDLFYRINVINMHLPPLRERREDIPDLINYFLQVNSMTFKSMVLPLSEQLVQRLQRYGWPGNIRQLENLVKRYAILGSEEAITGELGVAISNQLGSEMPPNWPAKWPVSLKKITRQAAHDLERTIILKALEAKQWNRKETARALRISYRALLYKMCEAQLPTGKPAE